MAGSAERPASHAEYGDAVVVAAYRDLFAAIAAAAAALTGPLFVACPWRRRRRPALGPAVIAADPGGGGATVLRERAGGLALRSRARQQHRVSGDGAGRDRAPVYRSGDPLCPDQPEWTASAARPDRAVYAALADLRDRLVSGIGVIANSTDTAQVQVIGYALVSSLIVGISRAWELVGDRETGLFASLALARPCRTSEVRRRRRGRRRRQRPARPDSRTAVAGRPMLDRRPGPAIAQTAPREPRALRVTAAIAVLRRRQGGAARHGSCRYRTSWPGCGSSGSGVRTAGIEPSRPAW